MFFEKPSCSTTVHTKSSGYLKVKTKWSTCGTKLTRNSATRYWKVGRWVVLTQTLNTHFYSEWFLFLYDFNQPGLNESLFLERHEEDVLFRYYERRMLDFCNAFKPAMPKSVVVCVFYLYNIRIYYDICADICFWPIQGTAIMYFRRFYLNNSIMEYHPRIIM